MLRELRGKDRYAKDHNVDLQQFITSKLPSLDFDETLKFYVRFNDLHKHDLKSQALLGCNDRYYLLTILLGRVDMVHPWLFERCREVEYDPDGYIDLWARYHGKSSIITTAGAIQEIMCNPEITIAIFSVVKGIAQEFLAQIKNEFETNETLKDIYHDVLYRNPRTKGSDGRPAKWGVARGITVKRKGKPKEATIEAHGLVDGQPTGRHFQMHIYDDVVTQDYLTEDLIRKTTLRWEMADNLGTKDGVRKWIVGTRYHFADTYGVIIARKSAKARIYAATDDGRPNGTPVLLSPERWAQIKNDQRSTVAAQMLLDPRADGGNTFDPLWLHSYDVFPAVMNVYILVDPSKGTGERSDRTAIAVIGIDQGGTKYLLDGARHRMKLSERWALVKVFRRRWMNHPGVQLVKVGWERYGKDVEIEVIENSMLQEGEWFEIVELNTPRQGGHSKNDRIERLEPDMKQRRLLLPAVVHHSDYGGLCYWSVWDEESARKAEAKGIKTDFKVGQIIYRRHKGLTARQQRFKDDGQSYRVVEALRRLDESRDIYDLTRCFMDEALLHPFAPHDDMIDVVSRIYDIDPVQPVILDAQSTEPIGLEDDGVVG